MSALLPDELTSAGRGGVGMEVRERRARGLSGLSSLSKANQEWAERLQGAQVGHNHFAIRRN